MARTRGHPSALVALVVAGVVAMATIGCARLADAVPPPDAMVEQAAGCEPESARALVEAASLRVETPLTRGAAFHVGDGVYLTALHVVDGYSRVELLRGPAGESAFVLSEDPRLDVAVLRSDLVLANALPLATDLPHPGDPVWGFGFSRERGVSRSLEYVRPTDLWTLRIAIAFGEERLTTEEIAIFEGRLNPGDSGSALVTNCGEVIAMATGYVEQYLVQERFGVAVSAEALRDVLDALGPLPEFTPVSSDAALAWPADGTYEALIVTTALESAACPSLVAGGVDEQVARFEVLRDMVWLTVGGEESAGARWTDGSTVLIGITWDEEWRLGSFEDGEAPFENVYTAANGCDVTARGRFILVAYEPG